MDWRDLVTIALAGALERVRRNSREPEVVGRARSKADRSRREVDSETRRGDSDPRTTETVRPGGSESRAAAADPLAATLVCTVAVAALDVPSDDRIAPEAWIPGRGRPDEDLVAVGASLAHRRFDTDVDRLAARSGVSRQELSRRLRRE